MPPPILPAFRLQSMSAPRSIASVCCSTSASFRRSPPSSRRRILPQLRRPVCSAKAFSTRYNPARNGPHQLLEATPKAFSEPELSQAPQSRHHSDASALHVAEPASISIETYHKRADAYIDTLVAALEELQERREEVDVEYSVSSFLSTKTMFADRTKAKPGLDCPRLLRKGG